MFSKIWYAVKVLFTAFSGNPSSNPPTIGALGVSNGGTGATTAAQARDNLGIPDLPAIIPVEKGGTNASDAATARANLGIVPADTSTPGLSRAATLEETLGLVTTN